MKKQIAIIGLALFAAWIIQAQSVATVQTESIAVTTTLSTGVGAGLMSQAVIPHGQIHIVGTNAIISGQAVIVLPLATLGQLVTDLPTGYDITNLSSATFSTASNGVIVNAVLTKPAEK